VRNRVPSEDKRLAITVYGMYDFVVWNSDYWAKMIPVWH